ncbi:MAG: Ultraviolet N-glycosylase/AP lyase [Lentisphaerae bacterium ADurb.BinA184]|nr:MAG: Ultraviolet N-glycosylase/AP lyase [Lentisphaerae bacterium ADurb.BinA184]
MHPGARIELDFANPLELTVATVLSAQCTDVRVNQVTKALFRKYRCPADYLAVPAEELEADIRPTGFFRQKAKSLRGIMQGLIGRHGGEVPRTMEELTALPGIGRKTANVILGNAFGQRSGVVVDTHVGRVAQRLGLTRAADPVKIEQDLMRRFPDADWILLSHRFIFHGRYICKARRPECGRCELAGPCPFARRARRG